MPYRHAHWYLLLLFPLTGLAFWPTYFSKFSASPYAFHVHGLTASLWIALLAVQSWTIHHRRAALHRGAGMSSLALFPFFLVGGLLVLQTMAHKVGTHADLFYDRFGYGLHIANGFAVAIAATLYLRAPRHGRPFLIVGGLVVLQSLLFETLGRTRDWAELYVSLAQVPTALVVSLGLAAGILAGAAGWIGGQPLARREARA